MAVTSGTGSDAVYSCWIGHESGMNETVDLLSTRRSVAPVALDGPAPDAAELATLLRLAARVPDHGKLAPWRFIVFEGEGRRRPIQGDGGDGTAGGKKVDGLVHA